LRGIIAVANKYLPSSFVTPKELLYWTAY